GLGAWILRSSMTRQETSWPESAKHVPATSPTYPVPTIVIFIATNLVHFAPGAHEGHFPPVSKRRHLSLPLSMRIAPNSTTLPITHLSSSFRVDGLNGGFKASATSPVCGNKRCIIEADAYKARSMFHSRARRFEASTSRDFEYGPDKERAPESSSRKST